ncbi:Protease HtpX [Planctomycetes bacterium Pan216]|uniref:Protease HtpX n=1 Tax=Kolteria novifilia TaxID=2527975 RepID=A0A518B744_9BACT|nr:Protease HtpX [Planctomycetes bacterium Pan216]
MDVFVREALWPFAFVSISGLLTLVTTWVAGRLVRAEPDHPAIAERLQQYRMRSWAVQVLLAFVGYVVFSPEGLAPWAPLVLFGIFLANAIAFAVGDHPTRRKVFQDDYSLGEVVGRSLTWYLAMSGHWMAITLVPFVVYLAGPAGWLVGIALIGSVTLWLSRLPQVACWFLNASELAKADLLARFAGVSERSSAPRPEVKVYGSSRGTVINAFAFPSLRQPVVLLTHHFVESLSLDEAGAIFAHETAHMEQFDKRLLQRQRCIDLGLLLLGGLGPALLLTFAPYGMGWFLWGWMPFVLVAIMIRSQGVQQRETEADLRAVELCGDGEALIRGLVKVHESLLIPRRVDPDVEQSDSHPSLSHRVQAIRAAIGPSFQEDDGGENVPPEKSPLAETAAVAEKGDRPPIDSWEAFASAESLHRVVVLENRRLTWMDFPKTEPPPDLTSDSLESLRKRAESLASVVYSGLGEVRVVAKKSDLILRVVNVDGGATELGVRREDAQRLQAALDRIDGQLSSVRSRSETPLPRLVAAVASVVGILALDDFSGAVAPGLFWLFIIGMAALGWACRSWLAALGGVSLAVGISLLVTGEFGGDSGGQGMWVVAALLLCGVYSLYKVLAEEASTTPPEAPFWGRPTVVATILFVVGVPGLLLAPAGLFGALSGEPSASTSFTSLFFLFPVVGATAAFATKERRWQKRGGVIGGLVALLLVVALASSAELSQVPDPLAGPMPTLAIEERLFAPERETTLGGYFWGLSLAPSLDRFIARPVGGGRTVAGSVYRVADFEGNDSDVAARDLAFIDGGRLLALRYGDAGIELQALSASDPRQVLWRLSLEEVDPMQPTTFQAAGESWSVVQGLHQGVTTRWSGRVGSPEIESRTWPASPPLAQWRLVGNGDRMLEVQMDMPWAEGNQIDLLEFFVQLPWMGTPEWLWKFVGPEGKAEPLFASRLAPDCRPAPAADQVLCGCQNTRGRTFWLFNLANATYEPVAGFDISPNWAWDGKRLVVARQHDLVVVDLASREGLRIPLPIDAQQWQAQVSIAESGILLAWPIHQGRDFRVVLLSVE